MNKWIAGIVLSISAAISSTALADGTVLLRDRPADARPALLFVGTIHFSNPGLDVVNTKAANVLTAARQAEIAEVVKRLEAFHPTKIVVEWPQTEQNKLDERYADYRNGRYILKVDEIDQISLRLARLLRLPKVYAADWNDMPPGSLRDYDYETYAEDAGSAMQERLASIRTRAPDPSPDWLSRHSVLDWLTYLNDPETQARSNRAYFDYALLGDSTHFAGPNWVGSWYTRNVKIFANIVRIADSPHDRVLVLFGNGHGFLQREFASQSGAFEVVDAASYLNPRNTE